MNQGLKIEALNAEHQRATFKCGVEALDIYFRQHVTQDIKCRLSNCFVLCDNGGFVAGYYTFAAASIPLPDINEKDKKRLPRYAALPAGLVGRLAIDQAFQGQRLGGALIIDAALRASKAEPAIFALIVEAKDNKAAAFYEHLGFQHFASKPKSLYLPLATALQAVVD